MERRFKTPPAAVDTPRIARYEGMPLTAPDAEGVLRYIFENGKLDEGSGVETRNPYIELGGIATNVELVPIELPIADTPEALTSVA